VPGIPAMESPVGRLISVGLGPGKNSQDPTRTITKAKRAVGVDQVVESLPSKCKALIQTQLPPKKKKKTHLSRFRWASQSITCAYTVVPKFGTSRVLSAPYSRSFCSLLVQPPGTCQNDLCECECVYVWAETFFCLYFIHCRLSFS
jgi:hypothetical protein